MKTRLILLCMFCMLSVCSAGAFIFTQGVDERALESKVKQIDEFFSRFNFESGFNVAVAYTVPSDTLAADSVMKTGHLASLLDLERFTVDGKPDSTALEFIGHVIRNNRKINYADSTWCAEATATCVYGGKTYPLNLFLRTQHIRNSMYKWVISDVRSPLFANITDSIGGQAVILPGEHGVSFISLPETVNLNNTSVQSLFGNGYTPDARVVFAWLVADGRLKMKNVTKVRYHFTLDNYHFTVERLEREGTYNNGWLITEIIKTDSIPH